MPRDATFKEFERFRSAPVRCTSCRLIQGLDDRLSEKDRKWLKRGFANPDVPNEWITNWLKDHGIELGPTAVLTHRRNHVT